MDALQRLVAGEVITQSNYADALTVYALQNRQLVQTRRAPGEQWVAVITDYGREAASTGLLPLELPLPVGRASRKVHRPPEEPATSRARATARAAVAESSRGGTSSEMEAQVGKPTARRRGGSTLTDASRNVLRATRAALKGQPDDHGLLRAKDNGAAHVSVSKTLIPRAMDFLTDLFWAAQEAGVGVKVVERTYGQRRENVARVILTHEQTQVDFRLVENTDRTAHEPTKSELDYKARHPWTRLPEWDYHPNGTLAFSLDRDYFAQNRNPRANFNDGVRALLEDKISDIIQEIVDRGQQDRARRLKWERLDVEYKKAREAALATAAQRYLDDLRAKAATAHALRWQEATMLRAYAEAMQERVVSDADQEWVAHLFAMADRLHPPDRVPAAPELPDTLTESDLKDHFRGWPDTRPLFWGEE